MIIGLMGRQRAGKNWTAKIIRKIDPTFTEVALADKMRKAYYDLNPIITWDEHGAIYLQGIIDMLGWDRAKEEFPEIRRGLQRFGTEMGRNNFGTNFWIEQAGINSWNNTVVTDVRFQNEIDWVRKYGGDLWRINRLDLPPEDLSLPKFQHASEKDWRAAVVDVELLNPGPDDELEYEMRVAEALSARRSLA